MSNPSFDTFIKLYQDALTSTNKEKNTAVVSIMESSLKSLGTKKDIKQNLASKIISFASELISKLQQMGYENASSLNKEIQNLLNYCSQIQQAENTDLQCSDPLKDLGLTFNEIAGQARVKRDMSMQYVYPFQLPKLFVSKAKGILLYGMPGTGKTLLAKAATAEINGAAFYAPSPGELRGKYEGETEKLINQVFQCAELAISQSNEYNVGIIFFDEFDSIAGDRGNDEGMRRSVNVLLQAMDGIKSSENVSVIAATNYPWDIDDAVSRRFGTRIYVDLPDEAAREFLIKQSLEKNYKMQYGRVMTMVERYGSEYKITPDFIREIVEKTGPTSQGKEIRASIENGTFDNTIDYKDSPPLFGYSGSDITKMMNIAFSLSAVRALETGVFCKVQIGNQDYFILNPMVSSQGAPICENKYIIMESKLHNKDNGFILMSNEQKKLATSFDVRKQDILNALDQYPTTIKNDKFIRVYRYYIGK